MRMKSPDPCLNVASTPAGCKDDVHSVSLERSTDKAKEKLISSIFICI